MKAHELAKKLLALPNDEVVIITAVSGPYTTEKGIAGFPWSDKMGNIRIQVKDDSIDAARVEKAKDKK